MISIEDVAVELGGERVLEAIDLTVEAGRFVGLVGPNGAGKTTLLRTVNGLLEPTAGQVSLDGDPVPALSSRELGRRVATVPQHTNLSFDFTVRQVVELGRHPRRPRFGGVDPDPGAIERALRRTATDHLADRLINAVSGGERQRVLLARALAQAAPVLLLDEPTANLDVHHQVRTLGLVEDLVESDDRTVVAAIHDLDLAARYCDELVLLSDGRTRISGPPPEVLTEEHLEAAFGGNVAVTADPATGTPSVTVFEDGHPERATDVTVPLD
ncbi:MAG: ATP-binding cassette domain-containing protein [Halobacteriales archaeon]